MALETFMAWREPLSPGWREEAGGLLKALRAGTVDPAAAARLIRLGRMRLGDGERLQLGRLARAAIPHAAAMPGLRHLRIALVSNRTLDFFARELEAAGPARRLLIECVETGYDAVASLALNPAAARPEGRFDAVFLLLDPEYFAADVPLLAPDLERAAHADAIRQFEGLIAGLRDRFAAPVVAASLCASPEQTMASTDRALTGARIRRTDALNAALHAIAADGRCHLFDLAGLAAQIGTMNFHDPARFFQAKVPFALEAGPVVADRLAALLAAMAGHSGRALVLDLDNTLWGGIVADDGVEGLVLGQGSAAGEAFLAIQNHALALRQRGIVLAVCSKNLEATARQPFRDHPDMRLREGDFAVFIANFDDKATNIARIAEALDLAPSSLVFLDDNPAERERVRSGLDGVMVVELGEDPADFARTLNASGFFEHLLLTGDDARRAETYAARAQAQALKATVANYDDYLHSLDMELTIAPFDALGRARIAQLIAKSNQFNLTTRRYSEPEVAAFEANPACVAWQIRLKDRFADHGMISVVIVDRAAGEWIIDSWIMSCRVLERGVEQAVMAQLLAVARDNAATTLVGHYIPTPRNALVRDFFPRLGFSRRQPAIIPGLICECEDDAVEEYAVDVAQALLRSVPLPLKVIHDRKISL